MAVIYLCFMGIFGPQLNWNRLVFWAAPVFLVVGAFWGSSTWDFLKRRSSVKPPTPTRFDR